MFLHDRVPSGWAAHLGQKGEAAGRQTPRRGASHGRSCRFAVRVRRELTEMSCTALGCVECMWQLSIPTMEIGFFLCLIFVYKAYSDILAGDGSTNIFALCNN